MGPIEAMWDVESTTEAFRKADEIIAKLEARVAALEYALTSQESRRPDPNADREEKWAIVRVRNCHTYIFDREDGFLQDSDNPALFDTRDDAIDTIEALGLGDLPCSESAVVCPVRVYADPLEIVNHPLDTETVEL